MNIESSVPTDIFFIGDSPEGYVFKEYAAKNGLWYMCADSSTNDLFELKEHIMRIAAKHVVFYLDHLVNFEDEIIEVAENLKEAINCNIIIFAPGYTYDMDLMKSLTALGVNDYVFSESQGKQAIEIERCITGQNVEIEESIKAEIFETKEDVYQEVISHMDNPLKKENVSASISFGNEKKRIAVVGAMGRIGTTTTSLQLVSHLNVKGYKACYIERNQEEYVNRLKDILYEVEYDDDLSMLNYGNVDMFNNPSKINQVLNMDYDYFVFDYGDITAPTVDQASILEKDIVIFVCGANPQELKYTEALLEQMYEHHSPSYIFNFVHQNEREDIRNQMGDKKDKTFFLGVSLDPFMYNPDNSEMFEQIINKPRVKEVPSKKRKFFSKGR